MTSNPAPESPRMRGRRIAVQVYYLLLAAVCLLAAGQVTREVLLTTPPGGSGIECRAGLRTLSLAIDRARAAAERGTAGEDEALTAFRAALNPEWNHVTEVDRSCHGSPKDEAALDAIEHLRYAEEHAVRREAGELAPLRRRVQSIVNNALGSVSPSGPRDP